MTQVGFKKMNWLPQKSAWNEHVERMVKRRTMMKTFIEQQNLLVNSFHSVFSHKITAHADNVARTAADRIIAEGKQKLEQEAAKLNGGLLDIKV